MLTMIPMLKVAAVVVSSLLAACSLYGGDGDGEIGPDAAGADAAIDGPPGSSMFAAQWECFSTLCESPLSGSDRAVMYPEPDEPGVVRLSWLRLGDPAPMGEHIGSVNGDCIDVPRNIEGDRSAYSLCPPPGAPTAVLDAAISWNESQWLVTLTPL